MIDNIRLLRNVGRFDSVNDGAKLPFSKVTEIYAENGRGKTTLASIFRSLSTNNPMLISERRRLGSKHDPHIVIDSKSLGQAIFQNGAWNRSFPQIAVFDDQFVSDNICSGLEIESHQRQNLHELILGDKGVALNRELQSYIDQVEEHNRALRVRTAAIPEVVRGNLTVDKFCALKPLPDIDEAIATAERAVAAARSQDAIAKAPTFQAYATPSFDMDALGRLLEKCIASLDAAAASRVHAHVAAIGNGGERWIGEGMKRLENSGGACPFCAQDLAGSTLLTHYRGYFSQAYEALKREIAEVSATLDRAHSGDVIAAFERWVRTLVERRQFWSQFVAIPEFSFDTASVVRAWNAAREGMARLLRTKQAAPLDRLDIPGEVAGAIYAFHDAWSPVVDANERIAALNVELERVKEQAASSSVSALLLDLEKLKAIKARFSPDMVAACDGYLAEKKTKAETEKKRDEARKQLDIYRSEAFPAHETTINDYLRRFGAGFRLGQVTSANARTGSFCTYNVVINEVPISVTGTAAGEPSFRTTLSAGDRNTLALAFFFASLGRDPAVHSRIVVIDDPMTSLDEHRSLATVEEIERLAGTVSQVIVLSHSKPFLCRLWDETNRTARAAISVVRDNGGSTLAAWNVSEDCITSHDKRHALIQNYIKSSKSIDQREVARALRPTIENFLRVAYPEHFPPGNVLNYFITRCDDGASKGAPVLGTDRLKELRRLIAYGNKFHHDTNPAYETEAINDGELHQFCERVTSFTRHSTA